jgi:hypothetical protein
MANHPVPTPARQLSPEEWDAEVEKCVKINDRIKEALAGARKVSWELAEALYEFDQERGWTRLSYENKTEWLADPEITLTQRTYERMVRAWTVLVINRKVDPPTLASLDITKVDIVLPAVEAGRVKLKKALNDAEAMGARDLREEYVERKERATSPAPEPDEEDDDEDDDDVIEADATEIFSVEDAITDLRQAWESGQANPRLARAACGVLLDHVEDMPVNGEPSGISQAIGRVIDAHGEVSQKRIPKQLNEAILELRELTADWLRDLPEA